MSFASMRTDRGTLYQLADVLVHSSVPLPELEPATAAGSEPWHFRLRRGKPTSATSLEWFHHWYDGENRRCVSFARTETGYYLRFHYAGDFRITPLSGDIECYADTGVARRTIRHLLLNQVMPLLTTEKRLVLHASGVAINGRVIGFAGPGGAGKSTLAATLCRRGATLVTDDALMVETRAEKLLAIPTYAGVRLWPDIVSHLAANAKKEPLTPYTSKRRVDREFNFDRTALPLSTLCILDVTTRDREVLQVERLSPRQALTALLSCTFQLDVADRCHVVSTFERLADLVLRLPVYYLKYPRSLARLSVVADEVSSLVA
jgi:hypothetical protein